MGSAPSRQAPAVLAVAAVVALATLVVSIVGLAAGGSDDGTGSGGDRTPAAERSSVASTAPAASLSDEVVTWLRTWLPKGTGVLTDTATAAQLSGSGLSVVTPASSGDSSYRFVVDTAALGKDPSAADAVQGTVPVAKMSVGTGSVTVRQVSQVTATQLADDAAQRREAEGQLIENPNLRAGDGVADVLREGELDLRAATVLAVLAADTPITVQRVETVAPEAAADRPARIVEISGSSADEARRAVENTSAAYRVESITATDDGGWRLVWPVDVTPVAQPR